MKLIKPTTIILAIVATQFGLVSQVRAGGLVGWWKLDEGKGKKAVDSSGNNLHGEIFGVTKRTKGYVGKGALKLTGGGIKIEDRPLFRIEDIPLLIPAEFTVMLWINCSENQQRFARVFEKGNDNHETINIMAGGNRITFAIKDPQRKEYALAAPKPLDTGKWYHIACVYDGSQLLLYINGKLVSSRQIGRVTLFPSLGEPLVIGNRPPGMDRPLNAIVDDIRMYNKPLSAEQIWQLYAWKGADTHTAALPEPADTAEDVEPGCKLSWMPGQNAASHIVYLGTDPHSVKKANRSSAECKGTVDANSFDPGNLAFGKTYYWRVDEITADGKLYKGQVWRFRMVSAKAERPKPSNGLKNVSQQVKLSWKPSKFAKAHRLYFGTDKQQVENATASSRLCKGLFKLGQESFDPGPLDEGTFYYWRVDEISDLGVAKGDTWSFRTKGGDLVLQIDLAIPKCDGTGVYPGTAKEGWTIWASPRWADMYMHDGVWLGADGQGVNGTGVKFYMSTGSEGQLGIGVKGVCRDNLGGGGCPKGVAQGDPIANSWAYAVDWAGPYAGDILLVIMGLPPGTYELYSYHNHWEPCTQKTRNCLDCVCGMPPMPSITAQPLWKTPAPGYKYTGPLGTGKGVKAIENAYNVAPQHVYSDDELVPSRIKFATDGSPVLVIYQADRTEPLYPDCARPGREGARGILNAFELIKVE